MKVGVTVASFQTTDWPRIKAEDWSAPIKVPDSQILSETLDLGRMIEPLGYDSIWATEHFGSAYGMWPDATQTLSYWAGQTERVDVGSCVIVLPWHQPITLAHRIAMLDNLLEGRRFRMGVGRGVARSEYEALDIPRAEARERFKEVWDIVKLALTDERVSYDGKHFKVPETSVRPRPLHADMLDYAACASTTQTSMEMAAHEGFSQLFVTGAPLNEMSKVIDDYNTIRAGRGLEPDQPTILLWMYCAKTDAEAERALDWFTTYGDEVATHYEFNKPGAFDGVKGYEAYAEMQAKVVEDEQKNGAARQGTSLVRFDTQPIGTPETIIERLRILQRETGAKEIALLPQFGGMSLSEAKASLKLFAEEVLPVIQADPAPSREAPVPIAAD
ncbi:MAG: LLM class flavin-dependent oxidoreductase [Actinobacteria bacterium]|nr:LLM class flavin-dependent oxidoreductase [Actinomycetota bacterium]